MRGSLELRLLAQRLIVADSSSLDFTATTTISAWIKPNAVTGTEQRIVHKHGSYSFNIDAASSRLNFYNFGSATTFYSSSTVLTAGVWQHVALVKSPAGISFYVNGKLNGRSETTQAKTALPITANPLYLGIDESLTTNMYSGYLDEVRLTDYAVHPKELSMMLNNGAARQMGAVSTLSDGRTPSSGKNRSYCIPGDTSACAAPVLELQLDEKTGASVFDGSGRGMVGSLGTGEAAPAWRDASVCPYGSCLSFDGVDDYASLGSVSDSVRTISFWLKPNSGTDELMSLNGTQNISLSGGTLAANGISEPSIYVDGVLGATIDTGWHQVSVTTATAIDANALEIGRISANYYAGLIDHLLFYDYVRTPAQIAWDFDKGAPAAYWNLDECQGNTAYDSARKSPNGTIMLGAGGSQSSAGTCVVDASTAWYNGREGRRNGSLSFDGTDDYVSVGNTGKSVNAISFWMKPNNLTQSIIALSATANVSVSAGTITTSGIASPTIYVNGLLGATVNSDWNHVLITTASSVSVSELYFGRSGSNYYNGQLDEIRLYSYVLTGQQIKNDHNLGSSVGFE
jgi:hypothetical protein